MAWTTVSFDDPTLYDLIGVAPDANPAVVSAAYHRALRKHHPDHGGNPKVCARIIDAGRILLDANRRRRYNARHGFKCRSVVKAPAPSPYPSISLPRSWKRTWRL